MAGDGKRGGRPSTRCASHDCDACRLWLAAKDLPKGKRRNREVIKAQKNHPCPRTAASQKKQRRGEAALLSAGGRGGQYRSSEVDVAPKLTAVCDLEAAHPRYAKKLRKQNREKILNAENVVVYAIGKEKPSAAYDAAVTRVVVSIVKDGKLPEGSTCEAFIEGVRVPGGGNSDAPELPDGLSDSPAASLEPLFAHVQRWIRWRDGCAAQYQGRSAFRFWQSCRAMFGIDSEDCRNIAHHGKCNADGATHVIRSNINASSGDEYEDGSRSLVRHLARKCQRPKNVLATGLYSATKYVYIYVPDEAVKEAQSLVNDEGRVQGQLERPLLPQHGD